MKTNKGYSLIEIVIGLAIIVIFLIATNSLVNASYDRYRLILQRNEAMDFAIREMEEILQSGETGVMDFGHTENNMVSRVKVEKIKNGTTLYNDKVFLVTVNVEFTKAPNDNQKYNIELKSLKVVE
ncbi:MAG: prepilin-type N-terminal cleavage/methylation domain-containing protein [Clostridia bacterium]|nr:prepilin-type N-terminal cleavage/methylation domain-containing protein [Clostridia bacterium]